MQQTFEQELSRHELQKLRNNRTGLTIFQFSWILVFVCLIVVNLQMRSTVVSWPPPGIERPSAVLPVVATVALLLSSVFVHRALGRIRAGDNATANTNLLTTLGLALAFVAIMVYEWTIFPSGAGQYGAISRLMIGFHGVHALAIGAFLVRLRGRIAAGAYERNNHWAVEAGVKLWDFVTVAWMLFFVFLYVI